MFAISRSEPGVCRKPTCATLHRLVMLRSRPDIAGRYADQGRYVLTDTGRHSFPSPVEIPALMDDFVNWLGTAGRTPPSRRIAVWSVFIRSTTATDASPVSS